ncbi:MAG: hypothetical protein ACFB0B_15425 [Thermonemataceae bacterium]
MTQSKYRIDEVGLYQPDFIDSFYNLFLKNRFCEFYDFGKKRTVKDKRGRRYEFTYYFFTKPMSHQYARETIGLLFEKIGIKVSVELLHAFQFGDLVETIRRYVVSFSIIGYFNEVILIKEKDLKHISKLIFSDNIESVNLGLILLNTLIKDSKIDSEI